MKRKVVVTYCSPETGEIFSNSIKFLEQSEPRCQVRQFCNSVFQNFLHSVSLGDDVVLQVMVSKVKDCQQSFF